jgi:hypothetical protein
MIAVTLSGKAIPVLDVLLCEAAARENNPRNALITP